MDVAVVVGSIVERRNAHERAEEGGVVIVFMVMIEKGGLVYDMRWVG